MTSANRSLENGTNSGLLLETVLARAPRGKQESSLISQLRSAIQTGSLPAGTRLPASRTLAADVGVSRGVVVRAYEQLAAEGYLRGRQGSGTAVADVRRPAEPGPRPIARPPTNPGLPPGSLFPRAAWLRSATRALNELPDADLGYPDPGGYAGLRHELSAYLGRVRALIAPSDRIVVVNGFGQASRLVAEVLKDRGIVRIAVEDPGSAGLREQLTQAGMTCHPVPVDDDGLRVDALARSDLRAVFVTPAHQFPTGVVMSPDRRHELRSWARDTGGLVIEDDYDAEFRYDRSPVGALQGLAPEAVVYGGSVSKTLAPALRLGWLVLPEHLVANFVAAKYTADLGTGVLEQAALAHFLACGEMDRHIRRATSRYRARRDQLVSAMATHLPAWTVTGTAAGLHLMAYPSPESDESALVSLARRCGLDARELSRYAMDTTHRPGLVIGYGHQRPEALAASVIELARRFSRPGAGKQGARGARSMSEHSS